MELLFTITPAHTDCRLQAALQREMQQHAQQQAALQARILGWQERWLSPLVLCLGLGGGLLAIARPGQPLSPEKIIAMLVSTVLCILLWKRYSARLLGALRQHQAMRQAPLQGLLRKLVRAGLRARLRRMEGGYRLQLDDQGFTLIHDRGARERLEWAQIARLQATPDFYKVASARLAAEGSSTSQPRTRSPRIVSTARSSPGGITSHSASASRTPLQVFSAVLSSSPSRPYPISSRTTPCSAPKRDSTAATSSESRTISRSNPVICPPNPEALASWITTWLPRWQANPPAPLPYGGAHSWDFVADKMMEALVKQAGLE